MKRVVSHPSFVAALGLIVLANVALLAAAGWNRRGEPTYELTLTERELALPGARQDEGTGLELSLVTTDRPPDVFRRAARWKHYELPAVDYDWLDRDKLRELGFETDFDPARTEAVDHYGHVMPRRVYVVLEYDGEAWNRWIARREEQVRQLRDGIADGMVEPSTLADAEAVLAADRTMRSRLIPVDAGAGAEALRRRYGDRHDHAIVAGVLRLKLVRPQNEAPYLTGDLLGLAVSRVHVTRTLRRPLAELLPDETWSEVEARERTEAASGWPSVSPPRYRAVMAIGRRYEPWLVDVARVGAD